MEEEIACDTTFLIDLQRSVRTEAGLAARQFLQRYVRSRFYISVIALGEFAAGFADERDPVLAETRRRFASLLVDAQVALVYRMIVRELRATGKLIGANDLWIAATALGHGFPLVTSNHGEFSRIRQLRVLRY
jgi:predicted nucleic acid-binding protein